MPCGVPTSHVHGAVTAIPLFFPLQSLLPRVPHALRRVGGGCGGHGDGCHGRKPGVVGWRRRSALIPRAVEGAGRPYWRSRSVASWVRGQPLASSLYKKGAGTVCFPTHFPSPLSNFPRSLWPEGVEVVVLQWRRRELLLNSVSLPS